jgi:hypothetical protein
MLNSLLPQDIPLCHKLHYLQMTTEKLAKGFETPHGGVEYKHTHDAFKRFVQTAKLRSEIQVAYGFDRSSQGKQNFAAITKSLESIAKAIEDLSPEGDPHPNPEYPWFANQQVYSPLDYPFEELNLSSPRMIKLLNFLKACFSII